MRFIFGFLISLSLGYSSSIIYDQNDGCMGKVSNFTANSQRLAKYFYLRETPYSLEEQDSLVTPPELIVDVNGVTYYNYNDPAGYNTHYSNNPTNYALLILVTNTTDTSIKTCNESETLNFNTCVCETNCPEGQHEENGICVPDTTTCNLSTNTNYPTKATNETYLYSWTESDTDRSNECKALSNGFIQERTQNCKKEYRCLKPQENNIDACRNQSIASYVSPNLRSIPRRYKPNRNISKPSLPKFIPN